MIAAILDHWVKPDKLEQAKALFAANTEVIRKLPGLVVRQVLQSKKDPLKWTTIAIWENEEAAKAWHESPDHIWDVFGKEPNIPAGTEYFEKYGKATSVHMRSAVGESFDVISL